MDAIARAGSAARASQGPSRRQILSAAGASLAVNAVGGNNALPAALTALQAEQESRGNDPYAHERGVNFYPSWCRSLPDLWTQYDREAVRTELSLARALGFSSVRV